MEASAWPLEKGELDRLVNTMPLGLLVEDGNGRILWVNETLSHFVGRTTDQLLGTRVAELPLTRVPGAGGTPDYCQIHGPRASGPEWLLCTWQRLSNGNGKGLIARYYLDATEHRRVQRFRGLQLSLQHTAGVVDQVTGTIDRNGIMQTLESEVSRSRRYQNPLAIIQLQLDICASDVCEHNVDPFMAAVARVLKEQTRWVDRIGRWSEREFLLVLPESNASAAASLAEKIGRSIAERKVSATGDDLSSVRVRFGISAWQRGDDVSSLLERAHAGVGRDGNT